MRSLWRLDSAGLLCVECVDCHALSCAKARNDSFLDSSAMDSKIVELESTFGNAKNVSEPAKDSRIVDEKAGLRRLLRGDKT